MRLYIIRHADPDYANNTITPAGHAEARALAERLEVERITHLHVSPLGRARDTARYAEERLGLKAEVEEWAQELSLPKLDDPPSAAQPAFCLAGETVRRALPLPGRDDWRERGPLARAEYVQAFDAVRAASDAFLARYGYERDGGVYRVRERNAHRVAVICHGGFAVTWLAHLLEMPLPLMWCGFWLPSSSVTHIVMDERSPGLAVPVCLRLGDTSHLYKAGLPLQPRGISLDGE